MTRAAIATLALAFALPAHADTAKQPLPPDEIADIESREANLEPNEPRDGLTFAFAAGGNIMLGGDLGVGRGPTVSLRLGHVATRKTIITFELTSGSGYHKEAVASETLSDNNFALFAGAQRYISSSLWLRAAGGLTVFVEDAMISGAGGKDPIAGVGGLAGIGVDLARVDLGFVGRFVVALEAFGIASVSRDGVKLQLALAPFSLSLY